MAREGLGEVLRAVWARRSIQVGMVGTETGLRVEAVVVQGVQTAAAQTGGMVVVRRLTAAGAVEETAAAQPGPRVRAQEEPVGITLWVLVVELGALPVELMEPLEPPVVAAAAAAGIAVRVREALQGLEALVQSGAPATLLAEAEEVAVAVCRGKEEPRVIQTDTAAARAVVVEAEEAAELRLAAKRGL